MRISTLFGLLSLLSIQSYGQTNVSVLDFGALGDAKSVTVNCVSNSTTVTVASGGTFTSADVGKLCQIFRGGPVSSPSNHTDFIGVISSVSGGTSLVLTSSPSITSNGLYAIVGTNNIGPFQKAIDIAGTNGVVNIPDGTYLLVTSNELSSDFTMANMFDATWGITITNTGLRVVGASTNAVLLGNGCWLMKGSYVQRGAIFMVQGPVGGPGTLSFENLTFNGNVNPGRSTNYGYWPARTYDGDGWDVTHDAILSQYSGLPNVMTITNQTE